MFLVETPLIDKDQLASRVQDLAAEMEKKLRAKQENTVYIGVLNGAFIFMADLMRSITMRCRLDFIKVASYEGMQSTGKINLSLNPSEDLTGKTVVLIEDIVDTGMTIKYLRDYCSTKGAKEVIVCTLLFKESAFQLYEKDKPDFVGFKIPDKFVVGYGMDYDGEYRHLPFIGELR